MGMDLHFLKAGEIFVTNQCETIKSVVTFGVLVSFFDPTKNLGGVAHFLYPYRKSEEHNNSLYAAPSLYKLISEFESYGCDKSKVEVQLFGGAHPLGAESKYEEVCKNNVRVAEEILAMRNYSIYGRDLYGHRGRKVVFHTETGESVVAKVNEVRHVDWVMTGGVPLEREEISTAES